MGTSQCGNEEADRLAKQALKHAQIDIRVSMSKTEVKGLIANEIKKWQKEWDSGRKGRQLTSYSRESRSRRRKYGNRKDDVLMSRMRIGHCLLISAYIECKIKQLNSNIAFVHLMNCSLINHNDPVLRALPFIQATAEVILHNYSKSLVFERGL